MSPKVKLIRTIYLYLAAIVSLIFVAVGTGTLLNTAMKFYLFPKAEKGGFSRCNQQPPVYSLDKNALAGVATPDQKVQLDNLLRDYAQWQQNNTGEECYSQERQNNIADALTMMLVAIPILAIHWVIIKKEKEEKEA